MEQEKITVYLDVDDTVLKSSEAIIKILNKKHNIQPPKKTEDLKDWGYSSIYRGITPNEIETIYASDEFFDSVEVDQVFSQFFTKSLEKVNFVFVTKGTDENLTKKEKYLRRMLDGAFDYVGLNFKQNEVNTERSDFDKRAVNMKYGIHIDDRLECLKTTNAPIKILLKKHGVHYWNEDYTGVSNLYIVNTWEEAIQIVEFAYAEHYIFKKC